MPSSQADGQPFIRDRGPARENIRHLPCQGPEIILDRLQEQYVRLIMSRPEQLTNSILSCTHPRQGLKGGHTRSPWENSSNSTHKEKVHTLRFVKIYEELGTKGDFELYHCRLNH